MKRRALLLSCILLPLLLSVSFAAGSYASFYASYSPDAQAQARSADLTHLGFSLTDEQEELFRLGIAHGYDLAQGSASVSSAPSNDVSSEPLVWIPTKGGTKYHKKESCSNMKSPLQVSLTVAKQKGYTPCSKCNPPQ
ncbi:MAG: hypothetical protein ACI4MJ_01190 [Aristaeellaceae bacterium]